MEETSTEGLESPKQGKKRSRKKRSRKTSGDVEASQPRRRSDPRPRRLDQVGIGPMVENKDPRKHYVLANPASVDSGQPHYQHLGYEVERQKEGDRALRVTNALAKNKGEPLEWKGSILMSCPKEDYKERLEFGDGLCPGASAHRKRVEQVYAPGARGMTQTDYESALAERGMTRRHAQQYFTFSHKIQ